MYGGYSGSTWTGYLRNQGTAAAPREVSYQRSEDSPSQDAYLNRGLEPGERVRIWAFIPESTVTIDPENAIAESDEANNVVHLAPLEDPGVACL